MIINSVVVWCDLKKHTSSIFKLIFYLKPKKEDYFCDSIKINRLKLQLNLKIIILKIM